MGLVIIIFKSDVWSFAVLLWELYSDGAKPYTKLSNLEVAEFISEGKRLDKPEKCPAEVFSLVTKYWAQFAKDRPSFEVVFSEMEQLWKKHFVGENKTQ